jgi:hypothetical protein
MIFERKDIEVRPAELCVRVANLSDIPPEIRERGVAICNDDSVWVRGEYAGRMVRIDQETTEVVDYANHHCETIVEATTVSVGRSW